MTLTHTHTHTHTHTVSDEGIGMAVKNSLEIIIKQVRLEGGFKRGGRIRVFEANCSRQMCVCVCACCTLWVHSRQYHKLHYFIVGGGGGGGEASSFMYAFQYNFIAK